MGAKFCLSLKGNRVLWYKEFGCGGNTSIGRLAKRLKVKIRLSLCYLLTGHHAMKAYWGSGGIAPRIFDLGTRWR
jgi:hypothetical protein